MRFLFVFFLISMPVLGQHANVTISNAATSNGVWTLVGTVNTFTPSADNANVNVNDLASNIGKFANDRAVEIKTACATCTQVGDVSVNAYIYTLAASTLDRRFIVTAGNDILVNQSIDFGYVVSSTNKGIGINFSSGGNIRVLGTIATRGNGGFAGQPQTSPAINLLANGTFYLATGVIVDASGTYGSNSYGGSAGKITISGLGGVSLFGIINALGGTSDLGPNTITYYGQSNEIEITTNNTQKTAGGSNDGLNGGSLNCINVIKAGTGIFNLSGKYNWTAKANYMDDMTLYLTINNGTVQLNNRAILYNLQMNSASSVFEIGNGNQEIYRLNGQGIIRNYLSGNAYLYLGETRFVSADVFNGQIQDGNGIVHVIVRPDQGGSIKFTGANTYTGNTELNSGTLILGASNVISDVSPIKFTYSGVLQTLGFNETLGPLYNSYAGHIKLNSSVHQLTFTSIGTLSGGSVLEIRGWQGDVNGQMANITKNGMLQTSSTSFVSKYGVIQSTAGINRFGQIGSSGIPSLGGKIVINSRLSSIQLSQINFIKTSDQSIHLAIQLGSNELGSDFTQ